MYLNPTVINLYMISDKLNIYLMKNTFSSSLLDMLYNRSLRYTRLPLISNYILCIIFYILIVLCVFY